MAQLTIDISDPVAGGAVKTLVFHFATVRTQEYVVEPVLDESGVHHQCVRVTFDIVGVVNAVTIATNKADVAGVGKAAAGDRLPVSMYNLRDLLMHPRRHITYSVGGVTVLELPRKRVGGKGQGDGRFDSDLKGGPFPQRASFTQISGDKSAVLSYRVVAYDTYNSQILLSNSWALTSDIDRHGYTTRTINGSATFRLDTLTAAGLEADDFRHLLLVPTPQDMRRVGVQVTESSAGDRVDYTVVDREVTVGLGKNSPAVEVTGGITSNVMYPIKDFKGLGGAVLKVFKDTFSGNPFAFSELALNQGVPNNANVGQARATGRKGSDRAVLSQIARDFLVDRFAKLLERRHYTVGLSVTHNCDTENAPFAEVRWELMVLSPGLIFEITGNKLDNVFNLANDFKEPNALVANFAPELPSSDNTRGTQLSRLVTQALERPTGADAPLAPNLPAPPPDDTFAKDAPLS